MAVDLEGFKIITRNEYSEFLYIDNTILNIIITAASVITKPSDRDLDLHFSVLQT